jgi:hypothetical protein
MRAILTFYGFTESEDHRAGTEDLYWEVVRHFAGPTITTYHPRNWTSDVGALIGQLVRQGIRHVVLISYSHGQAAATAFARRCYDVGIKVDLWLACDPVYRPTWLPRWNILQPFAFRAMLKRGKIRVPDSVRRVAWVRQEMTRPCGHDLVPVDPNHTHIQPPLVLPYAHTTIDSSAEWFALVRNELREWCQPKELP